MHTQERKGMKKFRLILCFSLTLICTGCSTIKGLGEDVSTLGRWITRGVDNVQEAGQDNTY